MTNPSAKPRRRWFQFSLRSLLGLVTLVVVLLVVWRAYVEPFRRQRETIALIEELGGDCTTVEADLWVGRLVHGDIENIILVDLADCDKPDTYIDRIADLPRLETLIVGGGKFTDEHLRRLQRVTTLRRLLLDSSGITREGLAALQQASPHLAVCCSDRRAMKEIGRLSPTNFGESPSKWPSIIPGSCPRDLRQWQDIDPICFGIVEEAHVVAGSKDSHLELLLTMFHLKKLFLSGDLRDSGLGCIAQLTELEQLHLDDVKLVDAEMGHLSGLTNLGTLWLCGTSAGDEGMAAIGALPRLEYLNLSRAQVGDVGMAHLKGVKTLRTLLLADTRVTDAALAHLSALPSLETLDLDRAKIGDSGVASLVRLPLRVLSLSGTGVTDAGLSQLREMPLEYLYLNKTGVTDAGLAHLHNMQSLFVLSLENTGVTAQGVDALKKSLPKCHTIAFSTSSKQHRVMTVLLYTRRGCHLCEEAKALLLRHGLKPQEIDVDQDSELRRRYNECVPVVLIDGRERFRGRVDERLLWRLVRNASREAT